MQINGLINPQSLVTSTPRSVGTSRQAASAPEQVPLRNEPKSDNARGNPVQPSAAVGASDDITQSQYVPSGNAVAAQNRYQYYATPTVDQLPVTQQRAVTTYTDTQSLGRTADANVEYLGSIDLFV